jgi:hypothetical protein
VASAGAAEQAMATPASASKSTSFTRRD